MILKSVRTAFLLFALLAGWKVWAPGLTFSQVSGPSIQIPMADFHFGEVKEGTLMSHDFPVKNTGSAILEILQVRPG
ncbi:MAG: hypothetical protein AB1585_06440 [Thermodesulfobacteriota bacterium]